MNGTCENCDHPWSSHRDLGPNHFPTGIECRQEVDRGYCGPRDNNDHDTCGCKAKPAAVLRAERETRRVEALTVGCDAHRRYQVKRPPKTACEVCWRLWIEVNP